MAVEFYKDVDSGVVNAYDTIIDDLIEIVTDERPNLTYDQAVKAATEMFDQMVKDKTLVKVTK